MHQHLVYICFTFKAIQWIVQKYQTLTQFCESLYNTIHVDGTWNQVADSLSCYYKYDTIEDEHPNSEFVKADEILDPDGDLAPVQRFVEIQSQAIRRSQRLQERTPAARLESQMLNETFNNIPEEQEITNEDTIIYTAGSNGKPLLASIEKEFDLNQIIRKFYWQDKMYSKILENPKAHAKFGIKEGLIYHEVWYVYLLKLSIKESDWLK